MGRAIQLGDGKGLERLTSVARVDPKPGPTEVLVHWRATSLNYHDLLVAQGLIPVQPGRIPMSDGVGQVMQVGTEVKKWREGDRVMSLFFPKWHEGRPTLTKTREISGENIDGFMCTESVISEEELTRIPDHLTFADAATLPCAGLTAWRALVVEGHLKYGQSVLVEGSGGVSIFALQIAKALGASVFATSSHEFKMRKLQELGADHVINYRQEERWGKAIYKLAGKGVDHVIDVGGGATFNQSIDAVSVDGHIASIGILDGRSGSITFPKLFFKHIHITGLAVGSREMQEEMVGFMEEHQLKPVVDRSFSFDELVDAFHYQQSQGHFGKIVVQW